MLYFLKKLEKPPQGLGLRPQTLELLLPSPIALIFFEGFCSDKRRYCKKGIKITSI